ncbi:hypothetical protein [Streptococcus porci]|uniref:hypothetical protein n=1 Tax=Streptococcus porci TaxID=502567 RepID=UPI000418E4EE|nr:hypothetical protein [Streptococcus porci]
MPKVLSCASYYGTGSSAITDFFSEFDDLYSMTNYEFRFLQDPDGVSDLEYNLVENHNRHNSGHALKRFKRLVDFNSGTFFNKRYEPFFDNQYKSISYEYIKELTDFSFKGYWFYDFYDRGKFFYYRKLLPGKVIRKLMPNKTENTYINALPNEMTFCSRPGKEKFIKCTQKYISTLLDAANKKKCEYIMVDQMIPPSNVNRYTKYFEDVKVFVVDRDPRDVYLLSKYVWKDRVIPTDSVEIFCRWFEYTRAHRLEEVYNPNTTMLVQFEDLIYKYNEITDNLVKWVGLDPNMHRRKKAFFDPNKSIKNTRLWIGKKEYEEEVNYIVERLPQYLYNYQD